MLVCTHLECLGFLHNEYRDPCKAALYLVNLHADYSCMSFGAKMRRRPAEVRRTVGVALVEIVFLMRYSAPRGEGLLPRNVGSPRGSYS